MELLLMASLQRRKIKGKYYWYIVESKRINGKPVPIVVEYLGTTDSVIARLTKDSAGSMSCRTYLHGSVFAFWNTALKYNIPGIIDDILPGRKRFGLTRGELIVIDSIYKFLCNTENMDISSWLSTTTLPFILNIKPGLFNNESLSKALSNISPESIYSIEKSLYNNFQSALKPKVTNEEFIYGNLFKFITIPQNAKSSNKTGLSDIKNMEHIKQYSISVLMPRNYQIPFFSAVRKYPFEAETSSSDSDFTAFSEKLYKYKNITILFDSTSVNNDITEIIRKSNHKIICSVPLTSLEDMAYIPLKNYKPASLHNALYYYHQAEKMISGYKCNIIIYYNQKEHNKQIKKLNREIEGKIEKLEDLRNKLLTPDPGFSLKRSKIEKEVELILNDYPFNKIINVALTGKQKIKDIQCSINMKIYDEIITYFYGKRVLITNNIDWSPEEVLDAYLSQTKISKYFKNRKKHWRIDPLKNPPWNLHSLRLHIFTCLLGIIISELLKIDIKEKGMDLASETIVNILSNIYQTILVTDSDANNNNKKSEISLINEMSESEKLLWDKVLEALDMK